MCVLPIDSLGAGKLNMGESKVDMSNSNKQLIYQSPKILHANYYCLTNFNGFILSLSSCTSLLTSTAICQVEGMFYVSFSRQKLRKLVFNSISVQAIIHARTSIYSYQL